MRCQSGNLSFSCFTDKVDDEKARFKAIKLYLDSQNLMISCYLYNVEGEDSLETRKKLLLRYNSAGLAPTIEIFNSTYSQIFYFKLILQTEEDQSTWHIDIPRVNITYNTDIAPIEEWFLTFRMHHGLNMFTTEGTLLDILREPILQWELGERITPENLDAVLPYAINITLSVSPCANDVAVIGLICNATTPGVYVGVTYTGFAYDNTTWFNMTKSLCPSNDDACEGLSLLNIVLTNHHLVLLTTMGLHISNDLCQPTGKILTFSNVTFCGFEMLSTCFYSYSPFHLWSNCLPRRSFGRKKFSKRPIAFLMDYQQNTGISVYKTQKRALVAVYRITKGRLSKKVKFPMFQFPNTGFMPYGMFFHPETHFLYVYGNEVWLSSDGGNSFHLLISLENEQIVKATACVYTHTVAFVSNKGSIFFSKAGKDGFRITDVEKTVVIPGSSSFLITAVLDNQTAAAEPTMPKKVPFNISIPASRWFMHDFGIANGKKWDLKVDTCRYSVQESGHTARNVIKYLDLDTTYNFTFRVIPQYTAYPMFQKRLINLVIGNPSLLEVTTKEYWDEIDGYILQFSVYNKFNKQVNYRPPSIYGIAIPISDNFYNADPSKPRMRNYYTDSKVSGSYKKCANKSSRAECNCTLAEKMSSLEIFSDCTEKVLRMRYPVTKLPIHFNLKHSNSITNLTFPYFVTITEVNQRENWEVRGINETSGILKIRFYLTRKLQTTVYSPNSLILSLYGSELFHFKVSTVPGVSHCNLSDEFQIYVDEAPLAYPGSFLLSALTALLIGGIIFVAFLVQLYQINIWDELKRKCGRFNKVSPSESSSAAVATSASAGEQRYVN
ncbi:PREDICTED: cation channel sperm-associated protein subunit beta [Tinamus guttatus]|uniref:cation channel sperm-associated protein subunit beta n=1 Tax=Tinamus guttatus TaxID=94827 RepID=UPI00052EA1FC|nr:PREDICTED: cation channel sperm-associated protein subunit beta [Tinamus guttatus]